MVVPLGLISLAYARWADSGNGSGRRRMPFTSEKIAVDAPIPSATVVSTAIVNVGAVASNRSA